MSAGTSEGSLTSCAPCCVAPDAVQHYVKSYGRSSEQRDFSVITTAKPKVETGRTWESDLGVVWVKHAGISNDVC